MVLMMAVVLMSRYTPTSCVEHLTLIHKVAIPRYRHHPDSQLEDKQHLTGTVTYRDTMPYANAARLSDGERSGGWGWSEFLPHSELGLSVANNRQYLKDDCLIFRIVSTKLN